MKICLAARISSWRNLRSGFANLQLAGLFEKNDANHEMGYTVSQEKIKYDQKETGKTNPKPKKTLLKLVLLMYFRPRLWHNWYAWRNKRHIHNK